MCTGARDVGNEPALPPRNARPALASARRVQDYELWVGAISDIRLKKVHSEVDGVLDRLDRLRLVRYNFKCDVGEDAREPRLGMIAQDVNELYGELGSRRTTACPTHTAPRIPTRR